MKIVQEEAGHLLFGMDEKRREFGIFMQSAVSIKILY